jgi:hypothetical protein
MNSESFCKVKGCRFSSSHITQGHKCGKCNDYGHGMIECSNPVLLSELYSNSMHDFFPKYKYCNFGGCKQSKIHSSEGHHCEGCNERLYSVNTCPNCAPNPLHCENIEITCPLCKQNNTILSTQKKVYGLSDNCVVCMNNNVEVFLPNCGHVCLCYSCVHLLKKKIDTFNDIRDESHLIRQHYDIEEFKSYLQIYPSYIFVDEGMGCCSLVRRLNVDSTIQALFVHSDDHYSLSKSNKIGEFIAGYCKITTNKVFSHDWIANYNNI